MGKNRRIKPSGNSKEDSEISDKEWNDAHTLDDVAKLCGYSIEYSMEGVTLRDDEHDMEIFIDKDAQRIETTKHLKEFIKSIYELDDVNKDAVPMFCLIDKYDSPYLGYHIFAEDPNLWEQYGHMVIIHSNAFDYNIKHTIEHESAHAIDYMMGSLTQHGGLSSKQVFRDALLKNPKITENTNTYPIDTEDFFIEGYADTLMICNLEKKGYGSTLITYEDGTTTSVDEWIGEHRELYEIVKKDIGNVSKDSFKKPDSFNHATKDLRLSGYDLP